MTRLIERLTLSAAAMAWLVAWSLVLTWIPAAHAQVGNAGYGRSDMPSRSATPPFFLVDTSSFLSSDGRPGVRVTVSIPYNQLHFVREGEEGFEAVFDISEIFYGGKHEQTAGDVWRHRVRVKRYRSTRSQRRRFSDTQEFILPPGKHSLVVRVKSYGTLTGSEATRPVVVQAAEGESFSLAGLEIGTCSDSVGGVVPLATTDFDLSWTRSFGDPLPHACGRAELFQVDASADRPVDLLLEVLADGRPVETVELEFVTAESRAVLVFDLPLARLGPGSYELRLTARDADRESSAGRDFEIDASRIDLTRNYDEMLNLAEIFLGEDVHGQLGEVPVAERRSRWNAFWVELDPDPDTVGNPLLDEFFRRIRVSAARFGGRGVSGWATDRGRIYVRLGEADDVETIPRGFNTPAYEIWRYVERNLTFVFADTTNFGDYVLVQPAPASY